MIVINKMATIVLIAEQMNLSLTLSAFGTGCLTLKYSPKESLQAKTTTPTMMIEIMMAELFNKSPL